MTKCNMKTYNSTFHRFVYDANIFVFISKSRLNIFKPFLIFYLGSPMKTSGSLLKMPGSVEVTLGVSGGTGSSVALR